MVLVKIESKIDFIAYFGFAFYKNKQLNIQPHFLILLRRLWWETAVVFFLDICNAPNFVV